MTSTVPQTEDPHSTPEAAQRLRRARRFDRTVARVIAVGGVAVLAAVVLIFVFVGAEAVPLLRGADVAPAALLRAPGPVLAVGADEYRTHVVAATADGEVVAMDVAAGTVAARERVAAEGTGVAACAEPSSDGVRVFVADAEGRLHVVDATVRVAYDADGRRSVSVALARAESRDLEDAAPAAFVSAKVVEEEQAFVATAAKDRVALVRFKLDGERVRTDRLDTRELLAGADVTCLATALLTDVVRVYAGLSDGRVARWDVEWDEDPRLHEAIETGRAAATSLTVLLGGETLVCGTADGSVSTWFGVRASPEAAHWDLARIRTFARLPAAVAAGAAATRTKSFVVLAEDGAGRVEHATTGDTRATFATGGARPTAAAFAPKNDAVVVGHADGTIRLLDHADPHPEAGVRALFGKLWYEGGTEPEHKWQSTGGTDEFEPKLSVTTLVFGTVKGVLYALLFSVPVALLAAIYTALFLPARVKAVIKPVLEIMAALPSVVIGLLAALWLSPLVERHLASAFALLPAFAGAFGVLVLAWALLPRHRRTALTQTSAAVWIAVGTVLAGVALAAALGPWAERTLFDGDVKAWLRRTLDWRYDPRNATVVGFAMGFAVIPVVFTIAEDAIHNVPKSLWAASEALGASRWQTTVRVVLPAATPGVFAALMLGFGRAVGETMIVLMATGNTPILDLSPFNGMRTISACIAVEIPEAPHGGTLYRVLFLAGTLLFVFTFLCNTVAEVVGSRLRRRYGRAG